MLAKHLDPSSPAVPSVHARRTIRTIVKNVRGMRDEVVPTRFNKNFERGAQFADHRPKSALRVVRALNQRHLRMWRQARPHGGYAGSGC